MAHTVNPFIWKENFPPVYGHTSIAFLKRCPGFLRAKGGDMDAALTIVKICVKQEMVAELNQKYPNAVLLPVITGNKLPEALAAIIGLRVYSAIRLRKTVDRKSLSAMERLLHLPDFDGSVSKGEAYIIVDDIVTQGGTVSALRKYIIARGGFVIAVTALAYSVNSRVIAPSRQDISLLMIKFNYRILLRILKEYQIAEHPGELTNSQVKYLLRFGGLSDMLLRLERACGTLSQKVYGLPIHRAAL